MRIDRRVAEERLDPVDQPLRGGVLHVFGLLVNLVPGHLERPGQEQFQQAMAANDLQRQPLAGRGEPGPLVRRVGGQAGLGKRFEHARDGSRRDPRRLRDLSGSHRGVTRNARGDQGDRLDVILDGEAGHFNSSGGRAEPIG